MTEPPTGETMTDPKPLTREERDAPPLVSWCPQCGPKPRFDEDGCCVQCGATTGEVLDVAVTIARYEATVRDLEARLSQAEERAVKWRYIARAARDYVNHADDMECTPDQCECGIDDWLTDLENAE